MSALRILMVTGCSRQAVRGRGDAGVPGGSRPAPPVNHCGQLASMLLSAVLASSWPATQEVISRQNEPEPTSPGIWSDPSNTHCVALFWSVAKFLAVVLL